MLYIMRHGKTDWNGLHKLQGRTDILLNEEGRSMARKARDEYRDIRFDICFSSPLKRALETAEIFLDGRDVPIIIDDRLKEMSFGDYEGVENSFDIPGCPINIIFQDPASYKGSVGGAETFEELFARVDSFISDKITPELNRGSDILIVGHGALNSAFITRMKHLPVSEFWSNGLEQCRLLQLI